MHPGARRARRFLAAFLVLLPSPAWAAHPFITDDTGTQGRNHWQLEATVDSLRSDRTADAGAGPVEQNRRANVFITVLAYGVREDLDVQLGLTHLRIRTTENGVVTERASGVADSAVELKWRLYEAERMSFGIKPVVLLPTGGESKGLGTGRASWSLALLTTYTAEPWTFLGNLAYSRLRFKRPQDASAGRSDLARASAGLSYALTPGLRFVGEAGLRSNELRNDAFQSDRVSRFVMAGVVYSPAKRVEIDAGFRKNLNEAEFDRAFLIGATFRW